MSDLATMRTKVIGIVRDDSAKLANPADYEAKVAAAINQYSKYRPAVAVADIQGNGTHDYSLPTGWNDEFSGITGVEYPSGRVPEEMLDLEDWGLYQSPTGKKIRIRNYVPSVGETIRVTFTILRTATTIPTVDVESVCQLAAALCLEELANAFAQAGDSTIDADSVNYRTKSAEFAARAKRLMQLHKEHMGLKENDITPPASAVTDLNENFPGGSDRLTHPRWARERR
ncbi:MAG: hypothetical protein NTY64_15130 [Deltaproteobacteria bacterium]|nr:hypothetical protein [Deltaproteobacteria bacterium]